MKIQSNKENYLIDNLKSTTSYLTATSYSEDSFTVSPTKNKQTTSTSFIAISRSRDSISHDILTNHIIHQK